ALAAGSRDRFGRAGGLVLRQVLVRGRRVGGGRVRHVRQVLLTAGVRALLGRVAGGVGGLVGRGRLVARLRLPGAAAARRAAVAARLGLVQRLIRARVVGRLGGARVVQRLAAGHVRAGLVGARLGGRVLVGGGVLGRLLGLAAAAAAGRAAVAARLVL